MASRARDQQADLDYVRDYKIPALSDSQNADLFNHSAYFEYQRSSAVHAV